MDGFEEIELISEEAGHHNIETFQGQAKLVGGSASLKHDSEDADQTGLMVPDGELLLNEMDEESDGQHSQLLVEGPVSYHLHDPLYEPQRTVFIYFSPFDLFSHQTGVDLREQQVVFFTHFDELLNDLTAHSSFAVGYGQKKMRCCQALIVVNAIEAYLLIGSNQGL